MSPRPRNTRMVFDPPRFKQFNPTGYSGKNGEPVHLLIEEFTAVKLCDYELLTQAQSAHFMEISRPTFTRIYESARRKIAEALAEARAIEVDHGNASFSVDWFHCRTCHIFFTIPEKSFKSSHCPLCGSENTSSIEQK